MWQNFNNNIISVIFIEVLLLLYIYSYLILLNFIVIIINDHNIIGLALINY